MIKGLTDRIQLAVASKVAIGLPKTHPDSKGYPQKLDHFAIEKKNAKGEWEEDKQFEEELRMKYSRQVDGKYAPLREFDIVFLSDDIEDIFKTEYAMWSASEKQCSGDGEAAMRAASIIKGKEHEHLLTSYKDQRYIPWTPCGDTCPEKMSRKCKPSGQLSFMYLDRPAIGAISVFFTTSYRTVIQIHSSLTQIKQITGGRLRGIPLRMVLRPGKTSYEDPKTHERKTSNAFFVNIEFRQADHTKLLPALLDASVQYDRARVGQVNELKKIGVPVKMLAQFTDDAVVDELPEEEVASHMSGHFFAEAEPADHDDNEREEGTTDTSAIDAICKAFNITQARRDVVVGHFGGDWAKTGEWFAALAKELNRLSANNQQVDQLFSKFGMQPEQLLKMVQTSGAVDAPSTAQQTATAEPTTRRRRRTAAEMEAAKATPPAEDKKPDPPAEEQKPTDAKPEGKPAEKKEPSPEVDASQLSF